MLEVSKDKADPDTGLLPRMTLLYGATMNLHLKLSHLEAGASRPSQPANFPVLNPSLRLNGLQLKLESLMFQSIAVRKGGSPPLLLYQDAT
jgi:hypothetical protein